MALLPLSISGGSTSKPSSKGYQFGKRGESKDENDSYCAGGILSRQRGRGAIDRILIDATSRIQTYHPDGEELNSSDKHRADENGMSNR